MRRKSKERDSPNTPAEDSTNMEYDDEHEQFARPSPRTGERNWRKILILLTVGIALLVVIIGTTSSSRGDSHPVKTMSPVPEVSPGPFHALVVIVVGDTGVRIGSLSLTQETNGGPVAVTGEISGLSPNTKHGFHVHAFGDLHQGCNSTGIHFNPFNKKHGAPTDEERHVGDLGNIETDDKGIAKVQIVDKLISLAPGVTSIIGRALVVHAGVDDLGKGGTPDSLTTGNAGIKYGCGVIGFAP